jgi:hypothetical protein
MSNSRRAWLPVGVMLAASLPALGVDLSKIPRTIAKEPKYESGKPQYCLIVFGLEAEQRFWLVRDGERYFLDRNQNGDLTEADESWPKAKPPKKRGFLATLFGTTDDDAESAEFKIKVGTKKTEATLNVRNMDEGDSVVLQFEPVGYMAASSDGNGKLQFGKSAKSAPIIHFGGHLSLGFDEPYRLARNEPTEIYARIGTQGLGPGTFAYRSYRDVPSDVHPQLEVEFPKASPGEAPIREKFTLDKRC